jgi:long-chain acyl-CoA synthetase
MASLYKIFLSNIKKNPHQIFIYSLKKEYNGIICLKKIEFLRKFIKNNKFNTIGIKSHNSFEWILWYIAADSYNKKIVLIKNDTQKKIVNKIIKEYKIDYLAKEIPARLKLNVKIHALNTPKRQDILFTSGSTSFPKGVIIPESSYLHVAKILIKRLKQKKNDVELLSMPFDHSFGLVRLRCCLKSGSKMLVTDGLKDFPAIFKFSQENNLTGLSLVPSGLTLIKILLRNKVNLFTKKLKYCEIGSSFISKETRVWLKKNFSTTKIIHHYGMTEASRSFLIERGKNDDLKDNSNKIGKIIPGCKYNIIKKDKKSGELTLKGKNLFEGYQEKHQNNDKFFKGWFKTGDIVEQKGQNLYLIGRVDNQFNIGGNKIQAEMIEDSIESINQIYKCVCFTFSDEIFGNRLGLIIERKININKENIIKLIEKKFNKLPDFYTPKKIIFRKVLLTKNGKKVRNL